LVRAGRIGKLVSVRVKLLSQRLAGLRQSTDQAPPPELDYDLWLGGAPQRPYNPNRAIYHFRWFWDYSGGQMTNLASTRSMSLHWITGVKGANAVTSAGGRYFLEDNGECPIRRT